MQLDDFCAVVFLAIDIFGAFRILLGIGRLRIRCELLGWRLLFPVSFFIIST
jgi:hypothetical protein